MRIKPQSVKKGRIEIIPMIDVVFFLLVFSMLSALSMAEINTLSSDVPMAGSGESGEANRITVNHIKGKLFLTFETPYQTKQQEVTPEQITPAIAKEYKQNPDVVVLVNVDDTVVFEEGAVLLDAVKQAGPHMVVPAG